MTTSSLKRHDIVEVDRQGRVFMADVVEVDGQEIAIRPHDRRITYRTCTSRQVIGIWHASRKTLERKGAVPATAAA
jgi:hypothetical protein